MGASDSKWGVANVLAALAPPAIVTAGMVIGVPALAASSGVTLMRQVNFQDNIVRSGCAQATVVQSGSFAHFGAMTYSRVAAACSSVSDVPALYLYAVGYLYVDGAYCGAISGVNSGTASSKAVYGDCLLTAGTHLYQESSRPSFYKGTNCTSGDNCSDGYTSGDSVSVGTWITH